MSTSRRDLLTGAAVSFFAASVEDVAFAKDFAGALRPAPGVAAFVAHPVGSESLWLKRSNGEEIQLRFRDRSRYDRAAVAQLSWFMRDVVDHGHAVWMEPRLFDLLAGVQAGMSAVAGTPLPLVITSGYRTPQHNAMIETAARNSMHLYGYAADLKAPGFAPRAVALAASFFAGGGIGLYDEFTHLDVWKVRTWIGSRRRAPNVQPPGTAIARAPAAAG